MNNFNPDLEERPSLIHDVAITGGHVNTDDTNKGHFSLYLHNNASIVMPVELLNPNSSFARIQSAYGNAISPYLPGLSLEGLAAGQQGCVVFDKNGSLQILAAGSATASVFGVAYIIQNVLDVSLTDIYSYKALMEACAFRSFRIKSIKVTSQTTQQLDNPMTFFKSDFNGIKNNRIQPSRYIKPEQTITTVVKIIDLNVDIDGYSGISYQLNPGELVYLDFEIEFIQDENSRTLPNFLK